jgi:hypothetical protein
MAGDTMTNKPRLKLVGTDGNAFSVMARAVKALRDSGYTPEQLKSFVADMKSGDYAHALSVVMKHCEVY